MIIDENDGCNIAVAYDAKNAPLIAAAPALQSALSEIARLVHQNYAIQHAGVKVSPEAWAEMYQAVNEARADLALAKGEA